MVMCFHRPAVYSFTGPAGYTALAGLAALTAGWLAAARACLETFLVSWPMAGLAPGSAILDGVRDYLAQ